MKKNRILLIVIFAMLCAPAIRAWAGDEVDGVTVKDNKVFAIRGDKLEILSTNLSLPFDVEATTNGTFTVGEGKERQIKEGQVVRNDGWLLNPDGSIEPVFDHVVMKNGRVYVVRDGQASAISKQFVFPNNITVDPDGTGSNLPGGQTRMQDGQLFRMDGTPVQARDTVTLKDGRVVVQKEGTLIPLSPVQMMGMSDGTRVFGTGRIQKMDGTIIELHEGKTIFLEGAKYSR